MEVVLNFDLTPDQIALQERVREFAQAEVAPRAEQLDREAVFPTDLFQKLGELGVMSIPFSEELGGMGLGVFESALAIEEIARADQSLAVSAMVSIATGLTVARFGSEQQKQQWLPDIVAGRRMCSIAGTEPDAGSDTAGFKTRATEVSAGKWSLSGEKAYITNPGTDISSFAIILAVSSPREAESKKFTLFLLPSDTPGYTCGWVGVPPTRGRSISTIASFPKAPSSARCMAAAGCCIRAITRLGCFFRPVRLGWRKPVSTTRSNMPRSARHSATVSAVCS
jgi:short/branched chain acyl-CoA dehydrogenase